MTDEQLLERIRTRRILRVEKTSGQDFLAGGYSMKQIKRLCRDGKLVAATVMVRSYLGPEEPSDRPWFWDESERGTWVPEDHMRRHATRTDRSYVEMTLPGGANPDAGIVLFAPEAVDLR